MQGAQIALKQQGSEAAGLGAVLSRAAARIFGCWHREMSRPFTHGGQSYRACLDCGARRTFDTVNWKMVGAYYYGSPAENQRPSLMRTASLVLSPRASMSLPSGAKSKA
ncbi:MAG TPA: hypothetical protein VJT74_07495 [Pyrinomonadaceae bacterium]|nr:hypothetical protein [Pyrinomonadaceae bacterium]